MPCPHSLSIRTFEKRSYGSAAVAVFELQPAAVALTEQTADIEAKSEMHGAVGLPGKIWIGCFGQGFRGKALPVVGDGEQQTALRGGE